MSPYPLAVGMLLAVVGCACFYLASPHQRWRATSLPAVPARATGGLLSCASLYAFSHAMHFVPAAFTFVLWTALLLVALPYVGAALFIAQRSK